MLESIIADLKKPSERDFARFVAATHYYHGGHYEEAARVCEEIRVNRLPSRYRHRYPPFLKQVKERSAPSDAARYRDRIDKAFRRAVNEDDRSAAQKAIDILKDHQFLLPQDQMSYIRARCCEVLGRQRTASLFYREAWQFNPEDPKYLSSYLESLRKEGRHAEARAIIEEELANRPGVPSSIKAMAPSTRESEPNRMPRKSRGCASN
jgi:tetratricopeptide (TPR) repeat protein